MMSSQSKAPLNVRFSSTAHRLTAPARDELIDLLFASAASSFPAGFNLAIINAEDELLRAWSGAACSIGETVSTTEETLYDLASLTKVVATTTIAMHLVEQGRIRLLDCLRTWLPDYPRDDTTLLHLLTHTSGLIAHRPFFRDHRGRVAIERAVYDEAALDEAAGNVLYSDLNFMLLGWAIEACVGLPLDEIFTHTVASPLGMSKSSFRPPPTRRIDCAATEFDGDQRLEAGLIWGEVHDGNAWALGGVSGHAGLFAPAGDVVTFVRALLDPSRHPVLGPSTINQMTSYFAGASPTERGLGWSVNQDAWGDWPQNFWHTGFTGTSILVSTKLGIGVVLLANAVHPHRQLERQTQFRIDIHNAIARCIQ
jgi:CubicO group peptidase (beta-lactamase class C family)